MHSPQINLHIIGVQKAGTTALANFLDQHPDIYVVDGKEAHVFDHPHFAQQTNKPAFIARKYKQRLSRYQNQPVVCDATPITLFHPAFLNACYQYNSKAKFIVMLRDPVERAVSHYQMSRKREEESLSMLAAFMSECWRLHKIKNQKSWPFDSPFRNHAYLLRGRYSVQLKRLFGLVPATQILLLMQRDLLQEHDATMTRIFEFIGVPPHPTEAKQVFVSENKVSHWSDKLAKAYARAYFRLTKETPSHWAKIIDKAYAKANG